MVAPVQTSKSDQRHRLLEATIDVIARDGVDAVTHRRVADVAGVPLGSTTYYFASREDLLLQAMQHFGAQEAAVLRRHFTEPARRTRTPRACADKVLELIAPQTGSDRARTIAQFALLTEASRRTELRPVVQEWNETWRTALAGLCAELGAADSELTARMILALIDGLLLSQLAAPEPQFVSATLKPALRRAFAQAAAR